MRVRKTEGEREKTRNGEDGREPGDRRAENREPIRTSLGGGTLGSSENVTETQREDI